MLKYKNVNLNIKKTGKVIKLNYTFKIEIVCVSEI